MIEGMKDGNSSALSCIDTSGHGHFGWTDELWKDGVRWDITGEHFYSERGVVSIRELHLEVGLTDKLALMKKNYGRPVWITEFNYWFADGQAPDKQAMGDYLATTMAQYDGWAREFQIEAVDIYEMLDQPQIEGREGDFGLYTGEVPQRRRQRRQELSSGSSVRDLRGWVFRKFKPAALICLATALAQGCGRLVTRSAFLFLISSRRSRSPV
jgi:Glycosyl hydrolase catalytic core.